jgi:glycosyltransferase involved in cell wall biosynthesis
LTRKPVLAIVVPCYNEEEVLPETARQLMRKINGLISTGIVSDKSKIVFVDDGSTDNTWPLIEKIQSETPDTFAGIKFSKNRGHENASLCGLLAVKDTVDAAISMDADLQHDISAIDDMLKTHQAGCEIVYGIKSNRKTDSLLKRATAQGFYRFMRFLGADIIYNSSDYRLMGKQALLALSEYQEVNLFLRGIVPLLGYKTGVVYFSVKERFAGKSKYSFKKLLLLAMEVVTSFSIKPIRFISVLGFSIFSISIAMIIFSIIQYFSGNTIPGYSSLICSIWGIGGLILLGLGAVGEYVGKIYLETKRRPRFIIEKTIGELTSAPY